MTSTNKLIGVLLWIGCTSTSSATAAETLQVQQNEVAQWWGHAGIAGGGGIRLDIRVHPT